MRSNSIFWGLVLVIAGSLFLLKSMGIITFDIWQFFWPSLLILGGLWLLLAPRVLGKDVEMESLNVALGDALQADLHLSHGAGRLEISALDEFSGDLIQGEFYGGVQKDERRDGSNIKLRLKTPDLFVFPPFFNTQGLTWMVRLSPRPVLRLRLDGGASDSELDLSKLKVEDLQIDTGASATRLTLPAHAGYTRAGVKCGAASVEIRLPEGVAGRIHFEGGLMGIDVDTNRFPKMDQYYASPDFENAVNRADIRVDGGVGSVKIY